MNINKMQNQPLKQILHWLVIAIYLVTAMPAQAMAGMSRQDANLAAPTRLNQTVERAATGVAEFSQAQEPGQTPTASLQEVSIWQRARQRMAKFAAAVQIFFLDATAPGLRILGLTLAVSIPVAAQYREAEGSKQQVTQDDLVQTGSAASGNWIYWLQEVGSGSIRELFIKNQTTGEVRSLGQDAYYQDIESKNGFVYYSVNNQLWQYDPVRDERTFLATYNRGRPFAVSDTAIAYWQGDLDIYIRSLVDPNAPEERIVMLDENGATSRLSFSPDGKSLVFDWAASTLALNRDGGKIGIWKQGQDHISWQMPTLHSGYLYPSITNDGKLIFMAYPPDSGAWQIYMIRPGETTPVLLSRSIFPDDPYGSDAPSAGNQLFPVILNDRYVVYMSRLFSYFSASENELIVNTSESKSQSEQNLIGYVAADIENPGRLPAALVTSYTDNILPPFFRGLGIERVYRPMPVSFIGIDGRPRFGISYVGFEQRDSSDPEVFLNVFDGMPVSRVEELQTVLKTAKPGDVVSVWSGIYQISADETIEVPEGVSLVSVSRDNMAQEPAVTFRRPLGPEGFAASNKPLIRLRGSNARLEGLKVQGPVEIYNPVGEDVSNAVIRNCQIETEGEVPAVFMRQTRNVEISVSRITSQAGVSVRAEETSGLRIGKPDEVVMLGGKVELLGVQDAIIQYAVMTPAADATSPSVVVIKPGSQDILVKNITMYIPVSLANEKGSVITVSGVKDSPSQNIRFVNGIFHGAVPSDNLTWVRVIQDPDEKTEVTLSHILTNTLTTEGSGITQGNIRPGQQRNILKAPEDGDFGPTESAWQLFIFDKGEKIGEFIGALAYANARMPIWRFSSSAQAGRVSDRANFLHRVQQPVPQGIGKRVAGSPTLNAGKERMIYMMEGDVRRAKNIPGVDWAIAVDEKRFVKFAVSGDHYQLVRDEDGSFLLKYLEGKIWRTIYRARDEVLFVGRSPDGGIFFVTRNKATNKGDALSPTLNSSGILKSA